MRPHLANGGIGMMSQPQLNPGAPSAARHEPSFPSQLPPHWQSGTHFGSPTARRPGSGSSPMIGPLPGHTSSREQASPSVHGSSSGLPHPAVDQPMDYTGYMMRPAHQRPGAPSQYGPAVLDHASAGAQQSHQIAGLGLHGAASYDQAPAADTPRFMPHQQNASSAAPHQASQSQSHAQSGFSSASQSQNIYYGQPRYTQH